MVARNRRLPVPALAAALASFALAAPTAHAANCPGADALPAAAPPAVAKGATLCLLNNERAAQGLAPLRSQTQLENAAAAYSLAMVQQRFFAHVSPTGEALQQRLSSYISGTQTWDIGENLAWGEGGFATPAGIVAGWMRSDGHRANILNTNFQEVGIGIVAGTPNGSAPESSATFTTEFGSRVVPGSDPSGTTARHADPAASSASTHEPATTAARKPAKTVSAAKKSFIKAQCARIARKTTSSRKARKARAARCEKQRLKAAARG
jgi:hypothetical protein